MRGSMYKMAKSTLLLCALAAACTAVMASDPSPLQDICVADLQSKSEDHNFPLKSQLRNNPKRFFILLIILLLTSFSSFVSDI